MRNENKRQKNKIYPPCNINFTDVNGVLYFTAYDPATGNELWKTNGTEAGTKLVADLVPGANNPSFQFLASAGGKLYFMRDNLSLWKSSGDAASTKQVTDAGIEGASSIQNITGAGNNLFFSAYTYQYGAELYGGLAAGPAEAAFAAVSMNAVSANESFKVVLYPNPVTAKASLSLSVVVKNASVTIADMNGRILWQRDNINTTRTELPVQQLSRGTYFITVTSCNESKVVKMIKA